MGILGNKEVRNKEAGDFSLASRVGGPHMTHNQRYLPTRNGCGGPLLRRLPFHTLPVPYSINDTSPKVSGSLWLLDFAHVSSAWSLLLPPYSHPNLVKTVSPSPPHSLESCPASLPSCLCFWLAWTAPVLPACVVEAPL